ncbi:hypothetical protein [Pseudomonas sp. RIT-PI-AD]|uniref:hypothetical protein n=1 Tax=Pseudomonas sp. RIT-PI-AD TaxID=3035294 RepID=UPI0021DA7C27|nr:hypothetical protein [Pseudomonas sp. RIT-PI-AD]
MSEPRVDPLSLAQGHERQDAEPRAILLAATLILVALLATAVGVAYMLDGLRVQDERAQPPLTDLESERLRAPEPRLEADPVAAGQALAHRAERRLQGYGWVDRAAGVAHIPLSQAQALLQARGWPNPAKTREERR